MVRDHQPVEHHVVEVEQEGRYRRGHAHGEHPGDAPPLRQPHARVEGYHGALPAAREHGAEKAAGDDVGEAGRRPRPQHLQPVRQQDEHEKRVERDVQQPAEHDAKARRGRAADAPQQVRQHIREHRGHAAGDDDAERVLPGKFKGVFPRAQQRQYGAHENAHGEGEERRYGQAQVYGERAHAARLVLPALPQQARDQRATADAGQPGQAGADIEYGQYERSGGDHVGVVRLRNVKRVRHIVDEHDELADDGRQHHHPQRPRHRQAAEHLFP